MFLRIRKVWSLRIKEIYIYAATHGLCLEKQMSTSVEVTSFPIIPVSLHSLLNFLLSSSFPVDLESPNFENAENVASITADKDFG